MEAHKKHFFFSHAQLDLHRALKDLSGDTLPLLPDYALLDSGKVAQYTSCSLEKSGGYLVGDYLTKSHAERFHDSEYLGLGVWFATGAEDLKIKSAERKSEVKSK